MIGIASAAVVALAGVATAAVAVQVAKLAVTPSKRQVEDVHVIDVGADTITLSSTPDSRLPGEYSLWFDQNAGHAKVGEIVSSGAATVTRKLLGVDSGDLRAAKRARLGGWLYLTPAELDVPYRDVYVQTTLGPAPAWVVPAESGNARWLIAVHGRGVRRAECLRVVETARDAGYTCLLISWRNDGDAPGSSDGLYRLGDSEWEDVDAALDYVIREGAKDVVLMGWSMGGAIVLQAATRSRHASIVRGIVLDSPVIDWVTALAYRADAMGVPWLLREVVLAMISQPWGRVLTGQTRSIDLDRLDFVARASELSVPMLVLHSDDDGFVPATASRALARARPDIVHYEAFAIARHAKLWNFDRNRWNTAVGDWLTALPPSSDRRGHLRRLRATG